MDWTNSNYTKQIPANLPFCLMIANQCVHVLQFLHVRCWPAVTMMNDRQAEQNQKPYRRPFHPFCLSSSSSKLLTDDAFKAEITEN